MTTSLEGEWRCRVAVRRTKGSADESRKRDCARAASNKLSRDAGKDANASGNIRVGPAGWSYTDWAGYVYPVKRPRGFHEAKYLAEFFDTIEINTSFYSPVRVEHAKGWIERVAANRNFKFTAKMWKRFADYPLVVEVRHATWNVPEVFELLRERGAGFCNIDQPLIGNSIEPSERVIGPLGYVRLHGRRYDTWFSDNEQVQ